MTKVNTYGIVLHWQGSDETALPVLMTAHQGMYARAVIYVRFHLQDMLDVVPVDPATFEDWSNPPYSGIYDGRILRTTLYLFSWTTAVARDLDLGSWIMRRQVRPCRLPVSRASSHSMRMFL